MSTNKIVANALRAMNADPDTVGIYSAAKKMIAAGAKHLTGYMWEIPEAMVHGANVIVGRAGGKVKVIRPSDRNGFVVAEVTDPLAQALERRGVIKNAMKGYKVDDVILANAVARNTTVTNDWKSYETAADIIKHATQAAAELEAMVKKATPWRAEMARMRQRADKLNDAYYAISSVDKGDPLYGKAVDAVKRWEKARAATGDLWFSI